MLSTIILSRQRIPLPAALLICTVGLVTFLNPTSAAAGEIAPGLERLLATAAPDLPLRVLVVMEEQVDTKSLRADLKLAGANRQQRHQTVVEALQTTATRSQAGLRAELASLKAAGAIRSLHPHWLVNGIVIGATPDVIRRLAARPGVARIEPDLTVELIRPVTPPESKARDAGSIGTTAGIRAIWADRVWRELGIDGTGALVGSLDSGVDGHHPALTERWRGNFAPAAECWLDASNQGEPLYPEDHYFHGTHVMGTICGSAPGDSIGVAPGARWIASNVLAQDTGPEYDSDILRSLEFMSDPDGDPATSDDVPDVVQNSWGVFELFPGYVDCDSRWWDAIDNCEATGVVLIWSAGNEGPNEGTLRSPADRADTPLSCFSVGAVGGDIPLTAAVFSSRGPSRCGGPFDIKPEVVAPGVDVISSLPGGDYAYLSGTSMSGPHVAGVVALMRSANPELDVETVKQILIDTAKDVGPAGEDGVYGHGMINAYDAVLASMTGYFPVSGIVRDMSTGAPIVGASVSPPDGAQISRTDQDGRYRLMLPTGARPLVWSAFGYQDREAEVEIVEGAEAVVGTYLRPLATAEISGNVTTLGTLPVTSAEVLVMGTPMAPVLTDAAGRFAIEVPVRTSYVVQARTTGMGADQRSLYIDADRVVDFDLPLLEFDDFELGHLASYPWVTSGDVDWLIDNAQASHGTFSVRAGDIGNLQSSVLSVTLDVVAAGVVSFRVLTSMERYYDHLRFEIDGHLEDLWSDIIDWRDASYQVDIGLHTFTWIYIKDGSVSRGEDTVWIDEITFPSIGTPRTPALSITPMTAGLTVAAGGTGTVELSLDNNGEGDLVWQAVASSGHPVASEPQLDLAKGRRDTSPGLGADKTTAPPDPYGYVWVDDIEPDGPVFAWLDPPEDALTLTPGDDENTGPLSLGFRFPFYGQQYDRVHVCSNGWLSFTSTATSYLGAGMPNSQEPNALIAPFWTDLNPDAGGTIRAWFDADGDRFVVSWVEIPHYPEGSPETFQTILHRDGRIVFQYARVADNTAHTIGIENVDGSVGLLILRNVPYLHDGKAFLIERRQPAERWLRVLPNSGVLSSGADATLRLELDASTLPPGQYQASVTLSTNDPDWGTLPVLIDLWVMPVVSVDDETTDRPRLGLATPNPFNPATSVELLMPLGGGDASLRIFDALGRTVRLLHDGHLPAGVSTLRWDGRDDRGRDLPSGTYLLRLVAAATRDARKLQLLR